MHFLILVLLSAIGGGDAVFEQRLTCRHGAEQHSLRRVWCRQSSPECCTGLSFGSGARSAAGGRLRVTQDARSFTVEALLEPRGTGGLYWCGLLGRNATIIKLAEGYFHSSSGAVIWSFLRWGMLPLLPLVTVCAYVLIKLKTKQCCKKDELYDDVDAAGALTEPVYDSPDPPDERESAI